MLGTKCEYCGRVYMLAKNYKAHKSACQILFKMRSTTYDEYNDSITPPPNMSELFCMIKILATKCDRLEDEIKAIKTHTSTRQRKNIIEILETTRRPGVGFYHWLTDIVVDFDMLFMAFNGDLTEGIKQIFNKKIAAVGSSHNRPLCSFQQKPGTIYVYDYDKYVDNEAERKYSWHIINADEVNRVLNQLSRLFIKTYLAWQTENEEKIAASETMQEQTIYYMMKVNGSKVSNEKRWLELKKWLTPKIDEDFIGVEF